MAFLIGVVILGIINFAIFHSLFGVVYFNLAKGIFGELVACFFVAVIEIALLIRLFTLPHAIPILIVIVIIIVAIVVLVKRR